MRAENNETLVKGRNKKNEKKKKRTAGGMFLVAGLLVGAVALFAAGGKNLPEGEELQPKLDGGQQKELEGTGLDDSGYDLTVDQPVPVVDSKEKEEGAEDGAVGDSGGEGGLRPPLETGTVLKGYFADSLVFSETLQQYETHPGVDLAAEIGTPVKTAAAGTVTKVYQDDRMGMTVVVSHTDGYQTVYSNLAVLGTAEEGDEVEAGQTIGQVGATALVETADPSHLHFEIRKEGQPVDPEQVLGTR